MKLKGRCKRVDGVRPPVVILSSGEQAHAKCASMGMVNVRDVKAVKIAANLYFIIYLMKQNSNSD